MYHLFIIFIHLEPGKEDCFYINVPENSYLELDYQVSFFFQILIVDRVSDLLHLGFFVFCKNIHSVLVVLENDTIFFKPQVIDGQQGELDIDFYISSPSGRRIVMESRKSDSSHRFATTIRIN